MRTLIKNGTIVTAAESYPADLLLADGRIALMGQRFAGRRRRSGGRRAASTCCPAALTSTRTWSCPSAARCASDDFYSGHKAAAFGGTTTHIDFVIQDKGETLHQAVERWHRRSDPKAVIDYGYHMAITDLTPAVMDEIPSMAGEGITTLKLFMAYKGAVSDRRRNPVQDVDEGGRSRHAGHGPCRKRRCD